MSLILFAILIIQVLPPLPKFQPESPGSVLSPLTLTSANKPPIFPSAAPGGGAKLPPTLKSRPESPSFLRSSSNDSSAPVREGDKVVLQTYVRCVVILLLKV